MEAPMTKTEQLIEQAEIYLRLYSRRSSAKNELQTHCTVSMLRTWLHAKTGKCHWDCTTKDRLVECAMYKWIEIDDAARS
jgi:hypothetical protein